MSKTKSNPAVDILKRVCGILAIPVICYVVARVMCASFGTGLFKDSLSWSTFFYGLTYLSLVAFAVSINLHSGRFDFSVSSIIILSCAVVVMLACGGVDNMWLLLLAGLSVGLAGGFVSGMLYMVLRLPPMIVSLGVALLYESFAYIVAGGSEANIITSRQPAISDALKRFIGQNGASPVYLLLVLGATLLFMIIVFGYTRFGYDYRALQSGQKIAVNTGANEYLNCLLCYMIAGAMAGLAGFFFGAQLQYTRVSSYLNFGTVSRMFDAFCPLFFAGLVGRFCNKQIAIVISVVGYEFLQVAFGNMNAVNTTFTSNIYGIINSVILVVFLIYLNNENKIIELVTLKKYLANKKERASEKV